LREEGRRPVVGGPGAPLARGARGPGLLRRFARTGLAGALYVLGGRLVLGVAREVTRMLPLPPLFLTLLAGLLVLGLVLTLALAWNYESVGRGGEGPTPGV
jgi:hypothetical protein